MNENEKLALISLVVTAIATIAAKKLEGSALFRTKREDTRSVLTEQTATRLDKAYERCDKLEQKLAQADLRHGRDVWQMSRIAADLAGLESEVYSIIDDLSDACDNDDEVMQTLRARTSNLAEKFRRVAERARPESTDDPATIG